MAMSNGVLFADYQRMPQLNSSLLTHANKSWKQFKWVRDHGFQPKTDTRIGTAIHSLVEMLPVERFQDIYRVMPDFAKSPDNKTKGGKQSTSKTDWVREQEQAFIEKFF